MEFPSAQWSDVTQLLAGDYLPRHKVYHHHNHHNLNVTNTHVSYTQTDIVSSYSYTRIFDDNDLHIYQDILSSLSYINVCAESGYSERTAGRGLSPTDMICTVYGYIYTIPWANQCRQEPHMSLLESWHNCNMPCARRGGKKARSLTQYIKLWIITHPSLPATS